MYAKAKIAGHPIHPMLVGFPVTLYTVTLVAFTACALGADPFWFKVAVYANVAGVVMAAIAAVPGLIDWALGVPTGSPAKATGLVHMVFNVAALVVFALNGYLHWDQRAAHAPEAGLGVALSAVGVALTIAAGWLGWKMVQKHHVGIDLTPEQQRHEPRASPRGERSEPMASGRSGAGHGQRIG